MPSRPIRTSWLVGGLILSGILAVPSLAPAGYVGDSFGISPFRDWRTIETEHFLIQFPGEQEEFANLSADYLEEAWAVLTERLYWTPHRRINVMVVDNTDAANGAASAFARLGILLYPIPPDVQFATSFTDDWLRLLIWHELTHFVNMDVTRSFYTFLRYLFGDTPLPNTLWPTWMLEGLAVYVETRFTHSGRGRSSYWEGVLRAATAENRLGSRSWLTLDRVNGTYPWFPGGESPYLFGYSLMNQVARDPRLKQSDGKETRTADGTQSFRDGEDALGLLSWRSGGRIPFFINGNLENLTSHSWYDYWGTWIAETRQRMSAQLTKIRTQPLTSFENLTKDGFSSWGATPSPDGKWLAYSRRDAEERPGLRLVHLDTKQSERLDDKLYGVGMAFTPDSRFLIYSQLDRRSIFNLFSDLHYREIPSGKRRRLTFGLRAKDPDISKDGKKITFTVADRGGNALALADLVTEPSGLRVENIEILYPAQKLSRVGTPRFSPDSQRIVFSVLERGKTGEALLELDLRTRTSRTLVSNGHRNVFPTFHPDGTLYFVSSRTGVENLFRLKPEGKPELVSNVSTGLWYPAFGPSGTLYASLLSTAGWDIARVELLKTPIRPEAVQVQVENAPPIDSLSADQAKHETRESKPYEAWRTLAPRTWAPILEASYGSVSDFQSYLGGMVLGFDALDFHFYQADLGYRTLSGTVEGSARYEYRGLGATLGLEYSDRVRATNGIDTIRGRTAFFSASLPIRFTWSSLTPSVSFGALHETLTNRGAFVAASSLVPRLTTALTWSDINAPALAIYPIEGRRAQLAATTYFESGQTFAKGILSWEEFIRLFHFWVLSPSIATSVTSGFGAGGIAGKQVLLQGRLEGISPSFSSNLSQMSLRGYRGLQSLRPWALTPSLDLRFPLLRVFEGIGTLPVFAENIWAQMFATTGVSASAWGQSPELFPAAGLGLRLDTTFFLNLPLRWGFDLHYGFNTALGGGLDAFFSLSGDLPI